MTREYFNQVVWWRSPAGIDKYGEPINVTDTAIRVRWEDVRRQVRNKDGHEVVSETRVFCTAAVDVGHFISKNPGGPWYPVIAVSSIVDLSGNEIYREVAL